MTAHADPLVLVSDDWTDYKLLDSGEGEKLEQVGPFRFVRPDAQALWRKRLDAREWAKADAVFSSASVEDDEAGRWKFNRELPQSWPLQWDGLSFVCRPTPFRHLAFFPEHSVHWAYAQESLKLHTSDKQSEVLNLFGYTGLASLACARAGARVTHIDASKKSIGFAKDNQAAAGLSEKPIRWIVDDALSFVQREIRRGRRYDGIILDPPKFGRGPNGETWRLETQLRDLVEACATLLRDDPNDPSSARGFMITTVYAVRLSFLALEQVMQDALAGAGGQWQAGDMALAHASDDRVLPTAIFARWRSPNLAPRQSS